MGIASEFALDALPPYSGEPDVTLTVGCVSALQPLSDHKNMPCHSQGRHLDIRVSADLVSVRVGSFLEFTFSPGGGEIKCSRLSTVSDQLLRYWLIQQAFPLYLLWNHTAEFLHGMAISTAQAGKQDVCSCIGFLGGSYAGKSTLLAYFLSRDHVLVGDDHLAVSRKNYRDVLPSTPYYRPYRAGEDLGLIASRFSPQPTPLKRVFLLEPALPSADIEIERLQGTAALSAILPHVQYNLHSPKFPHLFPLVVERFQGLNQLARQVSVQRLFVPRALDRLPEVYDFIQKELAS